MYQIPEHAAVGTQPPWPDPCLIPSMAAHSAGGAHWRVTGCSQNEETGSLPVGSHCCHPNACLLARAGDEEWVN